ncbi:AIPR family protein [Paenibacillus luteus]|uniref:AIPR family protein n=1 Tax=Paenibacillus luteus TaxID=2545753 RepID=UPI0011424F20|nr:AIPR family protein [Paenibacillus luteus]
MSLQEFTHQFYQNINEDLKISSDSAEEAFVKRMCSDLSEFNVTHDVQHSFWQKVSSGIKVNAYSYNDDDSKLSLFIAVHEMPYSVQKTISKTEIEKGVKRAIKFYEQCATGKIKDFIEESNGDVCDLATIIEQNSTTLQLEIFLLTNCIYKANQTIDLKVKGVQDISIQIWDIERLYQLSNEMEEASTSFTINISEDFEEKVSLLKVPKQHAANPLEVFIGYVSGMLLAKAYDKFGQRLIERNVRSFLQAKGAVNKGIKATLQDNKGLFISYNNGISTTAENADFEVVGEGMSELHNLKSMKGWQIVNGGQTTASLHHAWKLGIDISGVYVQMKLSVLKTSDEGMVNELISSISQYANTQNKISLSDLGANNSVHIHLEQLSRNVWAPEPTGRKSECAWYYERARGQYLVDYNRQKTKAQKDKFKKQFPKEKVISKTQLSKYFMAWEQKPHIVSKGAETNFAEFMSYVKKSKCAIDAQFYKEAVAKGIIFNETDRIVQKMNLPGYKANVVAYTIALLSTNDNSNHISLIETWNKQEVSPAARYYLEKTAELVWKFISNPSAQGTNISQWCKREECWLEMKLRCSLPILEMLEGGSQASASKQEKVAEATASYELEDEFTELLAILRSANLEIIDKRLNGGCLWVIDSPNCQKQMKALAKKGYGFNFSPNGGKTTGNKAAWFIKAN